MDRSLVALGSILALISTTNAAACRGSVSTEHPDAPEHIVLLPADIRRALAHLERTCASKAAATRYFSTTIDAGGQHFRSLYFGILPANGVTRFADRNCVCTKSTWSTVRQRFEADQCRRGRRPRSGRSRVPDIALERTDIRACSFVWKGS